MPEITIEPATSSRFDDAESALTGGGDGRACQCQWWTLTSRGFDELSESERKDLLAEEMRSSPVPGLIAYVDGVAAGWVRVGPRTRQPRLSRTRAYASGSIEDWSDPAVWAVSCFSVRKEHRGQGLNSALLSAAVEFARDNGARVVEAYPIDLAARPGTSSNELYHGALSTFLSAGFHEVARPKPHVAVVSLDVSDEARPGLTP
jgi:GNAT superfamily N-acetyltransferase